MKNQKSSNKFMLMLNKTTIANLNSMEMIQVGGGSDEAIQTGIIKPQTDPAVCQMTFTPVPTDIGIQPATH